MGRTLRFLLMNLSIECTDSAYPAGISVPNVFESLANTRDSIGSPPDISIGSVWLYSERALYLIWNRQRTLRLLGALERQSNITFIS